MARRKTLNKAKKGKGLQGGKWKHGFVPANAAARKLKKKLDRNGKRRYRTSKGYPKKR